LREGLLRALSTATGIQTTSVRGFFESGYFFVPGVKCPSEKNNKDFRPHSKAIGNCSAHLIHELMVCRPDRVLALGRSPMKSLAKALGFSAPAKVKDFRRNVWRSTIEGRP